MKVKKSVLLVTDYGVYPELTMALRARDDLEVHTEQLMRKAIKFVKKSPPDLLVAEFFHEPQFRDRVSNLESILSQIQKNSARSTTLILLYPGHEPWLEQLLQHFSVDETILNTAPHSSILEKINRLLGSASQ